MLSAPYLVAGRRAAAAGRCRTGLFVVEDRSMYVGTVRQATVGRKSKEKTVYVRLTLVQLELAQQKIFMIVTVVGNKRESFYRKEINSVSSAHEILSLESMTEHLSCKMCVRPS